jgi:uncharacterized protein (TIGR02001 family)
MKLATKSVLVLSTLMAATAAMAQAKAPEPDYTLSYNIGVVSDYRVRGIAQTSYNPAVQGGVDFAHKNGFYLGAWASNITWIKEYGGATDGTYEVDLYGGYKGEAMPGLTYDVGAITYQYPSNTLGKVAGYADANTTEVYGALTYSMLTFKYSRSVSNFLGNMNSTGSQYFDLSANFDLGNGFTLTPHLGRQTIPNQTGNLGDYSDYALTLAKDFGNGLVATAAAVGTNASKSFYTDTKGKFLANDALVVGLKYSF